ncbi:MAG: rRNA maturation RNase YbeY [Pseudomonadales bacterium]|nr:rRNA maturation RNase YbeY [Pseudomonadales bacterium]
MPAHKDIYDWLDAVLVKLQVEEGTELSIRLVDREESAQLNETYRHKTGPTNVLSFPFEATDNIPIPLLGDIVICAAIVEEEAREQNKLINHHWAHMVIHGTLHLLGYDHIQSSDAVIMENLEITIMAHLGLRNPYEITTQSSQIPERNQAHPLQPPSCSSLKQ